MLIRLQKYLSDCGVASRRKAEELILAGKIKVNGQVIRQLGTKIDEGKDKVEFQNKPVNSKRFIYIALNKPRGYTCTTARFKGEKNVLDLVKIPEKIFPVGRLDKDSQGLIFLTNDGDWAFKLTHPKFQIEKEYEAQIDSHASKNILERMKKGVKSAGDLLQIKNYRLISPQKINLILTQGHKREIRRLFEYFGYKIIELKRIRIDKWTLGNLPEGKWEYFQPE